jgi:hypothetical protein
MKPDDAESVFRTFLTQRGKSVDELTPEDGIDAMLEHYRSVRADGCELDADGDVLLFQWGTYNWGRGARFEFDITRQLIQRGEDASILQLSLTVKLAPEALLEGLGRGNDWCHHPRELPDFERRIRANHAYTAVRTRDDAEIAFDLQEV